MRKINGKFFLALLTGSLVLTGAVFGLHHFQYQRVGQALLWQAQRAEEVGNTRRMARYLQRYLEFNPRDDEAKVKLARIWAGDSFRGSRRTRLRALRLMDEVLQGEDRPQLRRELIPLALEVGDLKLAREHLQRLLPYAEVEQTVQAAFPQGQRQPSSPVAVDPDRGELEGYWAELLNGETRPPQAIACARLAVRHAPAFLEGYMLLANLLRRHQETDPDKRHANCQEADATIATLVQANPQSYKAHLFRWQYRREFDLIDDQSDTATGTVKLEEAASDIRQALELAPQVAEVLLAAADLERLHGQLVRQDTSLQREQREQQFLQHCQKAREYLDRGLATRKNHGGQTTLDQVLFQLYWHKANLILDELRYHQEKDERLGKVREGQFSLQIAEIQRTVEKLRKSPVPAAADYLQGRLLVHQRRWGPAARRLEQARALLGRQLDLAVQVNLLLGRCYEQLEEPTQMYDAFKRVLDLNPDSVPALLGMGAAEWIQGRLEEARARYHDALKYPRIPSEALIDLARLEVEYQLSRDEPNWQLVDQLLADAEKANPNKYAEVILLRADALLARGTRYGGGIEASHQVLKEARDKRPDEIALWTGLADLKRRNQQVDQALALLAQAEERLGDQVLFRLARARCYAAEKKPPERINALAEKIAGFQTEEQARLFSGLGDAQLRAGNFAEARKLWKRVAELPGYRTDLRLRLLLFDLAMKVGDEQGMQQALDEIRKVEGSSGAFHRYGEALRLIWLAKQGRGKQDPGLREARIHLDEVLTRRPGWAPAFLARAEIATVEGKPDEVLEHLQEAVQNGESSPMVIRRLAQLLNQRNRHAEAQAALGRLRRSLLRNSELGRLAAQVALQQKDYEKALELAKEVVQADTQDVKELIWLGTVQARAGDPEGALKRFRQAVACGDKNPATWLALVRFLAQQKRLAEADQAVAQAAERLPEEVKLLTLAQCHQVLGEEERAAEYFRQASEARPEDVQVIRAVATFYLQQGRLDQAEPLLRKILDGQVKASTSEIQQARRGLAIILASGTDYARFRKALELMGIQLDEQGQLVRDPRREQADSQEDKLFKARVLASQRQRSFRLYAIELLEELDRGQALQTDDLFILAVLYDQEGEWTKARTLLDRCVAEKAPIPQHLAYYIRGLMRQQNRLDLIEAARWLQQLEALEKQHGLSPNQYGTMDLRARLLEASGKGDDALDTVQEFATRPGARPEDRLLVVASLGRQQRLDEAYEKLAQIWEAGKCSPEVVGATSVALMRVMKPSKEQLTRVQQWVEQAITKNPNKLVLRMHLADLNDLQGNYQKAESLYRQVIQPGNEPNNMVALNNLAWLLVMQERKVDEAERLVTRAINGMGRRADLLDTRGLVHLSRGQLTQAIADFREASGELPSPVRLFHLARAHHLAREREEARKVLQQALDLGLEFERVHPIEREACRRLLAEYDLEPGS
jgi:tetratricopeptide (TPR) repeat protein